MNSRERFLNVTHGKPVDRRLFGAITSLYGAGLTGCPPVKYFNDAAEYALGQDAVMQKIAPDFLCGPFMLAGYGEAFGSTLHYTDNYVPNLLRPAISSAGEIRNLSVPDPDTHPRLLFIRESIRKIASDHGKEAVIVGIVLNPLDLPLVIMGLDAWMLTILTDRDGTRRMLDITSPFFVALCEKLFADGADIIAMPMAFFTRDITTRRIVMDLALPCLTESLARVRGPLLFHHTGSSFFEYLDLLDHLPAVAGFTLDVNDSIPQARSMVRRESMLLGGLDGPSLHTLSADAVRTRCLELLVQMKDDSRYVPYASGTDVEMKTPVENLVAIRQSVEEYKNG